MVLEKVKLINGSEVEINCKHLTGRRAFQIGPQVLKITGLKGEKGSDGFSADCEMNSAVDLCWEYIVVESPQRDEVCVEDMQKIYDKYAKKDIDFVLKKNLENFKTGSE